MTSKDDTLNQSIENYGTAAKSAQKYKVAKLLGFGAVAAGGLFTASDADADIVYTVVNAGFAVSTVNSSATNAANGFYFTSQTAGRNIFGLFGNNRGPANSVGSTDIVWLAGGAAANGAIKANGTTFPASAVPFNYSSTVGSAGSAATFVWADAGIPGSNVIDPFGAGNTGSVTAYFGFSFTNTASTGRNFGWGRIFIQTSGGLPVFAGIFDYAYENSGAPIHVGSIPEPSTGIVGLAALALGAGGMRRYRRKKKAA